MSRMELHIGLSGLMLVHRDAVHESFWPGEVRAIAASASHVSSAILQSSGQALVPSACAPASVSACGVAGKYPLAPCRLIWTLKWNE